MKEVDKSVLLVEGKDDQHVIWSLLEQYQVPELFVVKDCDGIENLLRDVSLRLTTPTMYKNIGVVMDADVNIKGRYDAFRSVLESTGMYDFSQIGLSETGTLIKPSDDNFPVFGLWLMPNNQSNGMLEDFVMTLADENDVLMSESDTVLASLEQRSLNRYTPEHRSKAKIHTYLAWQEEPGKPMGQAITSRVLHAESESAKVFIEWIKRLFIPEP